MKEETGKRKVVELDGRRNSQSFYLVFFNTVLVPIPDEEKN